MNGVRIEFLHDDGGQCYFMDPDTYDQVEVPTPVIGEQAKFLDPGMRLPVEFVEGRSVSVVLPGVLDVVIVETTCVAWSAGQHMEASAAR